MKKCYLYSFSLNRDEEVERLRERDERALKLICELCLEGKKEKTERGKEALFSKEKRLSLVYDWLVATFSEKVRK